MVPLSLFALNLIRSTMCNIGKVTRKNLYQDKMKYYHKHKHEHEHEHKQRCKYTDPTETKLTKVAHIADLDRKGTSEFVPP